MKQAPIFYLACDLHTKRMNFCVVDARPRKQEYPLPPSCIVMEEEIPATPTALRAFLRRVMKALPAPARLHLLVESTTNWFWVVDCAESRVEDITLVNALKAAHISPGEAKTDKLDARKIAWMARNRLVPSVYIPLKQIRDLRDLMRFRAYLVHKRSSFKNKIHSILHKTGVQRRHSDLFGVGGRAFLAALQLPHPYAFEIEALLAQLPILSQHIQEVEDRIMNKGLVEDGMTRILASLPGFGPILAHHARLEIGAIDRFPRHSKFVKYCALAPLTHQSQDSKKRKGLIHGNIFLKYLFIEAGKHAKTHPAFSALAQRRTHRAGAMSASINVGRKLAICAFYCLSRNTMFSSA